MSQSSIDALRCVSQLRAKALVNQPSTSVGFFFFIFFPCQRAATQRWHGPRAETVHTRLNGNGYRMDISTNAKQSSAGRGLELQRAGLARSIPSQGLIGQVERPDVTPNPPLRRSGSLCAPHPPERPESSPGFPGYKPSFVCPQQHRAQP